MSRPRKSDAQLAGTRKPGTPQKTPGLGAQPSVEWDRIVGELEAAGVVLTTAHAGLLAIAADIASSIHECHKALAEHGSDYTQAGTGGLKLHPAAARLDYLNRDLGKILVILGAAKPGADLPTEETDPMAKLLGKK